MNEEIFFKDVEFVYDIDDSFKLLQLSPKISSKGSPNSVSTKDTNIDKELNDKKSVKTLMKEIKSTKDIKKINFKTINPKIKNNVNVKKD